MKNKKTEKRKPKISKGLFWTPRIAAILFILFISMFALDIFDSNLGFWGTILGLFMHLIPSFIMIITLWISWKHEWLGGIVFILLGLLYIFMTLRSGIEWYIALSWSMTIAGPALFVGILFLINWNKKRRN